MRIHHYLFALSFVILGGCVSNKPVPLSTPAVSDQYYNPNCSRPEPRSDIGPDGKVNYDYPQRDSFC